MEIKIYQINMDRDTNRIAFSGLEQLEKYQGSSEIDSGIYDEVFSGEVTCAGLEDVFRVFNLEHPRGYTGRSLSVSDIVQVVSSTDVAPGFYFCDSFGFQEVSFDLEMVPKARQNDTILVVLLEPYKEARITEIGASLEAKQAVVGGDLEAIYPFSEDVAVVCNSESKNLGMPLNRAMRMEGSAEIFDIVAGPCFICDCSGESFGSLTPEQAQRYAKMFQQPEHFYNINGKIHAVPYHPEPENSTRDDRSR